MRQSCAPVSGRFPTRRVGALAVAVVATLSAAGCASTPAADDPVQVKLNDIDARVTRIERIISNQSLVELAQHLDQVQADVRQLRGRVEELEYNTESTRKQQRDLYSDLDKRLAAIGGGSAGGAAAGALSGSGSGAGAGSSSPQSGAGAAGGSGASATAGAGAAGSAAADSGGVGTSEEQRVYGQSFDALKAGSYSIAVTGFKDFLTSYPASPLAENAQYWLGEAYYVTRDFDSASAAFKSVLSKWPDSRKAPDALLKLGYTQIAQNKSSEGRATLSQVVQKYPGTDAAKLAADRLSRTPGK
jgi:tol-pal system protein YbgF